MLGRSLRMAFWITYDHIGKLILASLIWSLPLAVFAFLALGATALQHPLLGAAIAAPCAIVAAGILLPVLSAGLAHMVKQLIDTRDGSLGDMFRGIRLYWARASVVGVVYLAAGICLATSAWFYAEKLRDHTPWLGYGISAVALWCLAFLVLSAMLAMPTLVQKKGGVLETVKLSALLVLDNPLLMLGTVMQVAGMTAVAVVVPPVLFFLYGGTLLVVLSSVYEMLSRKYAAVEAASSKGIPPGQAPVAPVDDEHDEYLNRGFRDFLFPWKG